MAYVQHFDGRREPVDDVVEELDGEGKPTGGRRVVSAKVVTATDVAQGEDPDTSEVAETK